MKMKSIFSEIVSYFNYLGKNISSAKSKRNQAKEARYDIGIDDIKAAHEKIPKRLGYLTAGVGLLIITTMTVFTVGEQVSKAEEKRVIVDSKKLKEPEVEISISEQGWKHFQSKRIDNIAQKTQKDIEAIKHSMQENSESLSATLKNDLNETKNALKEHIKEYVDLMGENMESFKIDISTQLKNTLEQVDEKVKENKIVINDTQNQQQRPMFDSTSKLLPPPLTDIPASNTKKEKEDKKEIVVVAPDSDEYTFDDVVIDTIKVQTSEIATSLYSKAIAGKKDKKKYHIMKGLTNATLLTGIKAPTYGGGNNKNPAPVLFSIDNSALIANGEAESLEDCLISGSATGNVNTSKADILLTEISCSGYDTNGKKIKIEEQIKGWVIGEDGSLGVDGILLDSSGEIITKMVALEIIKGLSQAMVMSSMPGGGMGMMMTPGVQMPYDAAAQRGAGTGVMKGLDKTFQHYSEVLSGMYPTISVLAGKKVTLQLKGGEDIVPTHYEQLDVYEKLEAE